MTKIGGPIVPPRPASSDEVNESSERHGLKGGEAAQGQAPKKVQETPFVERSDYVGSGGKRRGPGLDLGDDSHVPIPLPGDEVDTSQWSLEGLDLAQGRLLRNSGQMRRARGKKGGKLTELLALWQQLLEDDEQGEREPDDEERRKERIAQLQSEEPPPPEAMAQVAARIHAQFGVELGDAPAGAQMMATSLLIAGQGQAGGPHAGGGGLDAERLADGVQQVMDESQSAVDDARRMHEGVHKNLSIQRTFVAKKR